MQNFDAFKAALETHPRLGEVTLGRVDDLPAALLEQPKPAADHCLARFGFTGIGEDWRILDRAAAAAQLAAQLTRSLAYGVQMLPPAEAAATAASFLSFCPAPDAVFLTNASRDGAGFGWNPVSASTFDACYVAIGSGAVAFIILEDED
jgi:hypothetical protein